MSKISFTYEIPQSGWKYEGKGRHCMKINEENQTKQKGEGNKKDIIKTLYLKSSLKIF